MVGDGLGSIRRFLVLLLGSCHRSDLGAGARLPPQPLNVALPPQQHRLLSPAPQASLAAQRQPLREFIDVTFENLEDERRALDTEVRGVPVGAGGGLSPSPPCQHGQGWCRFAPSQSALCPGCCGQPGCQTHPWSRSRAEPPGSMAVLCSALPGAISPCSGSRQGPWCPGAGLCWRACPGSCGAAWRSGMP